MFLVYLVCFLGSCFPVSQQASVMAVNPTITQFSAAKESIGLLAHSYQEGENFMRLDIGDTIYLNESAPGYRVVEIQRYHRDHPVTPTQGGTDLITGEHYTVGEIFGRTYGRAGYLVLQTCLETYNDNQWGLIFFLAKPIVENYHIPY